MDSLVAGQVYPHAALPDANRLYREMKIFPTPFRGIYYAPYETERTGWYITDPLQTIFQAVRLYLNGAPYYFGLYSAAYYNRQIWNAAGVDIINPGLSRRMVRRLPSEKYWRGKIISRIMRAYPFPIRFHRMKNFSLGGVDRKGPILFSTKEKTRKDAEYLCRKGDPTACELLKIL